MGLFKESMFPYVKKQIRLREAILRQGNRQVQAGGGYWKKSENEDDLDPSEGTIYGGEEGFEQRILSKAQPNNRIGRENLVETEDGLVTLPDGAFYTNTVNKSCTIRMASMVDLGSEKPLLDTDKLAEKNLLGPGLALTYILEGGTIIKGAKGTEVDDDTGETRTKINQKSVMRRGFPKAGQLLGGVYGDPISRGDADTDGYGIVPMPGIIDVSIKTKSAYGSLREGKVKFVCHNLRQLEVLELLYMRPGYPILLEWAWNPFINNEGERISDFRYLSDDNDFWDSNVVNQQLLNYQIISKRKESSGNYDALLGFVKNFTYTSREDGGFDCSTEILGMGEVLDGLKSNIVTIKDIATDQTKQEPQLLMALRRLADYCGGRMGGASKSHEDENGATYATYDDKNNEANLQKAIDGSSHQRGDFSDAEPGSSKAKKLGDKRGYWHRTWDKCLGNNQAEVDKLVKSNTAKLRKVEEEFERDMLPPAEMGSLEPGVHFVGPAATEGNTNFEKIGAPYIRLDALCHLINEQIMPRSEKDENSKLGAIQVNMFDPGSDKKDKDFMGTGASFKPSKLCNYKNKIDRLIPSEWMYRRVHYKTKIGYVHETEDNIVDISCKPGICLYMHQLFAKKDGVTYAPANAYMPLFDPSGYATNFGTGMDIDIMKQIFFRGLGVQGDSRDSNSNWHRTRKRAKQAIGNMYLNLNYLLKVAEKLYEKTYSASINIGEFLAQMIDDMNSACGPNHKFALMSNNMFPNVTNIVDLNQDMGIGAGQIFSFKVQSNDAAVRKFGFSTSVPSSMAATIAVAASNPKSVEGLDQVTFAAINRGINNRLMQRGNAKPTIKDYEVQLGKYASSIKAASTCVEILNKYRNLLMESIGVESIDEKVMGVSLSQVRTSLARLQTLVDVLGSMNAHGENKRNPPSSTPIPIKINLEMDGISGLVIGQLFKVDKSRLPSSYRHQDICFQLNSEEQKITAGGDWTVKFTGMMQLITARHDRNGSGQSNDIRQVGSDIRNRNLPHLTREEAKKIWLGEDYEGESEDSKEKALNNSDKRGKDEGKIDGGKRVSRYITSTSGADGMQQMEKFPVHPDYQDGPVVVAIYGKDYIQFDGWYYYTAGDIQSNLPASLQAIVYEEGGYGDEWPGQTQHTADGGTLVGGADDGSMDFHLGSTKFSSQIYNESQAIKVLVARADQIYGAPTDMIESNADVQANQNLKYRNLDNYPGNSEIPSEYQVAAGEPYKVYIVPPDRR
mgnify:CR=1 FL=1|tara:strand:- start:898 stop:4623 length:3726 start_codon:yes stop_codon:yes gene_type:complete